MTVNYQESNVPINASDFTLLPINTVLEMRQTAKYFHTVDLEARLYHNLMKSNGLWKAVFHSVSR